MTLPIDLLWFFCLVILEIFRWQVKTVWVNGILNKIFGNKKFETDKKWRDHEKERRRKRSWFDSGQRNEDVLAAWSTCLSAPSRKSEWILKKRSILFSSFVKLEIGNIWFISEILWVYSVFWGRVNNFLVA